MNIVFIILIRHLSYIHDSAQRYYIIAKLLSFFNKSPLFIKTFHTFFTFGHLKASFHAAHLIQIHVHLSDLTPHPFQPAVQPALHVLNLIPVVAPDVVVGPGVGVQRSPPVVVLDDGEAQVLHIRVYLVQDLFFHARA